MTLNVLKSRPNYTEAIHVADPLEPDKEGFVYEMPSPELIQSELDHWVDVFDDAVFEGHADLGTTAESLYKVLRNLQERAKDFERNMANESEHYGDVVGATHLVATQQQLAAMLGLSRLLQMPEVVELMRRASLPPEEAGDGTAPDRSLLVVDSIRAEYQRAGVHADEYIISELGLAVPRPEQELWYEGETVYVRVRRPASISHSLSEHMRKAGVTEAEFLALSSLVGRVKSHVWRGEAA